MLQVWFSVCRKSLWVQQQHPEMPGRRALCWCIGGSHPEITYTRDGGDGIALKPFKPLDIPPMPAEDDLNAMFSDLVVSACL